MYIKRPLLLLIGIEVRIFEKFSVTYEIFNLVKIRPTALSTKEGKYMNDIPQRRNVCNFSLRKKCRVGYENNILLVLFLT